MNKNSYLITGSSTGIGNDCALTLAKMGHQVFAGVRKSEDGDRLVEESQGKITPVILDVTKPEQIATAFEDISEATEGKLDGLINNAGIVIAGPLEFMDLDDFRKQMEVNLTGQLAVIQKFLPLIRKSHGGRIVNVGSISGYMSTPIMGAYSASKFALRGMSDALRMELLPSGIRVSLIEPGPIKTPIWEKSVLNAQNMREKFPARATDLYGKMMSKMLELVDKSEKTADLPNIVTKCILHALTSKCPETHYPAGRSAKVGILMSNFVPASLVDKLLVRALKN